MLHHDSWERPRIKKHLLLSAMAAALRKGGRKEGKKQAKEGRMETDIVRSI